MQYVPRYRKVYVASSWRNPYQPQVVDMLQKMRHEVYDFRDPKGAFHWSDIDQDWKNWNGEAYRAGLIHPEAERGYWRDLNGMCWCDTCVMVLPCGASAHAELGWCVGQNKDCYILALPGSLKEPELMYKMVGANHILFSYEELTKSLRVY